MFYSIIHDDDEIKRFIDMLPDDKDGTYYLQLLARKKFLPNGFLEPKDDEFPIYRVLCKKDEIFKNIKKMEVKLGGFIYNDKEVPNYSTGVYITMNPVSTKSSYLKTINNLTKSIFNNNYNITPDRLALKSSVSMKDTSVPLYTKKNFLDMDYDFKEEGYLEKLIDAFDKEIGSKYYNIIESLNGYHFIINNAKEAKNKKWYLILSNLEHFDDIVTYTPIPGTYLGKHKVKFLK